MEHHNIWISFEHDEITKEICPEAQGHFCMLWGEHGHGGYNSENGGYIQGGEPMDEYFELIGIYMDFAEARTAGNWRNMRFAITSLRNLRADMNISQGKEKALRIEEEEENDISDSRLPI